MIWLLVTLGWLLAAALAASVAPAAWWVVMAVGAIVGGGAIGELLWRLSGGRRRAGK